MEQEFFILLAFVATGTGLLVVVAKNPIHSALSLAACFVQIAALFVLLGSPFLAVIQIFVYVGAVMVLFLFVIMMLDVRKEARTRFIKKGAVPTFFVLLALAVEFYFLLAHSNRLHAVMAPQQLILDEPIKQLSLTLFRDFLLPFEMASVILLVALIGAVVLARSDESRKQKQQTTEEEAP
ncbi:MAG: NADH-quinone oxidoreductase subunit J [Nitrosomonadaceae bacterium]|jgi:NADH-quinone oxidoreductase subunit J